MGDRQQIIDRLTVLQQESGLSKQEFKKTLASITGKTPRTLRRWFALETIIQDNDIKKIASHFGLHENWLKFGDKNPHESLIDQIMTSNHFGAVVIKDGLVEKTNHKFNEMMSLPEDMPDMANACDQIMGQQSEESINLCQISRQLAEQSGAHHITMIMKLGDQKHHTVDVTTLNLNHGRILRIVVDKGLVY
jgi:hypothetical protein